MAAKKTAPASNPGALLLASCLEAPDDDAPSLVYADWLEERHDALAELIRLQVGPNANATLAEAFGTDHQREWFGEAGEWFGTASGQRPVFERGMLASLYGKTGSYAQQATQSALLPLLTRFGVRETRLRGQSGKLGACETLAWTTELWWWDCQLDDARLSTFAASPHLGRIRRLTLEKLRCKNAGLRSLAESKALPRLRHLGLPAPVHLGGYDASAVLHLVEQTPVTSLDLTGVNSLALSLLAASEVVSKLEALSVTTSRPEQLTSSSTLRNLERLTLHCFSRSSEDAFLALAKNDAFAKLKSVELQLFHRLAPATLSVLRERFGEGLRYQASTAS